MSGADWRTKRHHHELAERLAAGGFSVVGWRTNGKHVQLTVRRDGREGRIGVSGTPRNEHCALNSAMQAARRATRP